ncbi:MAG TPA: His/Gly/Thr/Pro-type tRNA ligase C-terminal domain-containing protein, partial [Alphaproteobacteria bacterium]|nr:His/Gly/Thr/Pro-type tRNA ligase C-terminal domain-containing protein [Alphaproteobacteria bacterium]
FSYLHDKGALPAGRQSAADVLMVLPSEDRRGAASEAARALRARGVRVEMYHRDAKIKNQMGYAEKKGIPYVWFPPFEDGAGHEVKDMKTGAQTPVQPENWVLPGA